jgi:hypothetical protein
MFLSYGVEVAQAEWPATSTLSIALESYMLFPVRVEPIRRLVDTQRTLQHPLAVILRPFWLDASFSCSIFITGFSNERGGRRP